MKSKRKDLLWEQYVDAQLALLMDAYANEAGAQLLNQFENSDVLDIPEELDRKCQTLIQREFAKQKRRRRLQSVMKISGRVAAVFLAVIGVCTVLVASVEAIRTPVINFIIGAPKDDHSLIQFPEDMTIPPDATAGQPTADRSESPLEGMIPEEYVLQDMLYPETGGFFCYYKDAEGNEIIFRVSAAEGTINFDTEDAIVTEVSILGNKGIMIEKHGYRFYWLEQETGLLYHLVLENWEYEEAWALAETVAACPDWVYIIPEE